MVGGDMLDKSFRHTNQASDLLAEIPALKNLEQKFEILTQVMGLCKEAIKSDLNNGDAHVMLAEAYYQFGPIAMDLENEVNSETMEAGRIKCFRGYVAVIGTWKKRRNRMPTQFDKRGQELCEIALESLEFTAKDQGLSQSGSSAMQTMCDKYYLNPISD